MGLLKDERAMFRLYTGLVILILLVAAFGPLFLKADPYSSNMTESLLEPSAGRISWGATASRGLSTGRGFPSQ